MPGQYAPAVSEWNRPVEPFRIAGSIYYVGASDVSSFLITSSQGHILIDTGFLETAGQVEANIRKLGFRLEDVRILLASHAHYDHVGGMAQLRAHTKARLLLNPIEVEQFARGGKGDFGFGDKYPFPAVKSDGLLRDGEPVRVGDATVTPHFTPGHTKGCASYSTMVREGNQSYHVVMPCSISAPGYRLIDNRQYPDIARDYESTFAKLRSLPCDIFLGSHGWDFGLADKLKSRSQNSGRNAFVDADGYRRWIDKGEQAFRKQIADQRAGAEKQ
jgi:metallo-beta-lactamase class B